MAAVDVPVFETQAAYAKNFTDVHLWRPYVAEVCRRHGFACSTLRTGVAGTHPVFVVNERIVVKFFTNLFGSAESYAAERDVYAIVAREQSLPAPALLADGALAEPGARWHWPYVIISLLPGSSFGEVRDQLALRDRLQVATWAGVLLRRLHALPLDSAAFLDRSWHAYARFLIEQRHNCAANHQAWGDLPEHLVAQIDAYLPAVDQLYDRRTSPCLLHGDVTEDHVLGEFDRGTWRPCGVIDFGDARVGDRLYELVALYFGLLGCDKRMLRAFLDSYGFDAELRDRFVLRAMSLTLLHEFAVLTHVRRAADRARDLNELALVLWDLDHPGSVDAHQGS